MGAQTLGLVLTVVVMVAIAVFILLFERRRSREIEADLRRSPPEEHPDASDTVDR